MRMRIRGLIAVLSAGAALGLTTEDARASSHREAPFVSKNPEVDGADFYMFRSYETGRSGYVTFLADYLPLEGPSGGPNFYQLDDDALYEIEVDNNGDGVEDITYQFRVQNKLNDPTGATGITLMVPPGPLPISIPFIQGDITMPTMPGGPGVFPITAMNESAALNMNETYSVSVVTGPRRSGTAQPITNANGGAATFVKPVDYIGSKTLGNAAAYQAYANAHINDINIPGCATPGRVFVGQRAEGFRVSLGVIFDLVNAPSVAAITSGPRDAFNGTALDTTLNKNITTLALEVPVACLTGPNGETVIGGWTTASVRQARVINPQATFDKPSKEGGPWAQVSRLGMPLTNEVVIGLKDKDRFNSSEPKDDAQFANYVTNASLPQVLQLIFGSANVPFPQVSRSDLVSIFLTGIAGVNAFSKNGTPAAAEMLRLNTALPVTPAGSGTNGDNSGGIAGLGAALCFPHASCTSPATCFTPDLAAPGCDPAGFPNGRRPGDDATDIELTSILGYFLPTASAPLAGTLLHDGTLQEETQFDATFPYLTTPHSGDQ
jgi:hypothetical protein